MPMFSLRPCIKPAIALALLLGVGACTAEQRAIFSRNAAPSPQPSPSPNSSQNTANLVSLFLVKRNNLNNELRAEVYPLALLLNDRYVEISQDVTPDVRNNADRDRIIEINNQRLFLNAIQSFTVMSEHEKLGEFQVEKPTVSQFACSSLITGQGNFQGQATLPSVFEQIPQTRSQDFNGIINNQKFNETWRTAIAVSQATPLSQQPAASEAELVRYRQDVLALGQAAIAQVSRGSEVPGEAVVQSIQVVDLDRDGTPEILGYVRQGIAAGDANAQQRTPTGFATVWMTYREGKPQLLETAQAAVSLLGSERLPYELLETVDLNGDGIDEVIAERRGYESTYFEIYDYKNNRLNRVFSGAGYGC